MTTTYSLDSQPYAIVDDPRKLSTVSLPGRLALIQRMVIDIGTGGINPPNRLRMYLRSEGASLPAAPLQVQVTGTNGTNLVEVRLIEPEILERARVFQWVEVDLVPIGAGFGTSTEREVLVWFVATEAGLGWEVASIGTGEAYPELRGPVGTDPLEPVFGTLLTYPAAIPVPQRLIGAELVSQVGPVEAGDVDGGEPFFASEMGSQGFIAPLTRGVTGTVEFVGSINDTNHVFYCNRLAGTIRKIRKSDNRQVASLRLPFARDLRSLTSSGGLGLTATATTPSIVYKFGLGGTGDSIGTFQALRVLNANEGPGQVIVNDGTHAYIGTLQSPARIIKVRISDMVRIGAIVLPAGENLINDMAISGTTLYVITNTDPVKIVRINLATFTRTDVTNLRSGSRGRAIAIDAAGNRAAVATNNGFLLRVDLGTMAVDGIAEPTDASVDFRRLRLDSEGRYAYATGDVTPAYLQRWYFDAPGTDIPRAGQYRWPAGNNGSTTLEVDDTRIFAGFRSSRIGRVFHGSTIVSTVEGDSLANSSLFVPPYFDGERVAGMAVDSPSVWLAQRRNPARVSRYNFAGVRQATSLQTDEVVAFSLDPGVAAYSVMVGGIVREMVPSTLATVDEQPLLATEPTALYVSPAELMIGTGTTPAEVVQVDRSDLTTQNLLTLSTGEGPIVAATGDSDCAYFLTGATPAQVVKVDLATNTVVDVLTLESGEGPGRAIALAGDELYCLCASDPGRVAIVDREGPTDPLTRVGAVNLQPNETLGTVMLTDGSRVWGGVGSRPGRIFRIGQLLAATGVAHSIQFDDDAQLTLGLDRVRNFREDADVAVQFGYLPDPPEDITVEVSGEDDDNTCVSSVEIGWNLPDDECALVFDGGYVEIQRQFGTGPFQTIFRVFGDVTRTVTDFECARNAENRYRLRIYNDAGFESIWSDVAAVEVASECCGYQFSSNQVPDLSVWYDDIVERNYEFPAQVTFLEFEGRDGSVAVPVNADRLDVFSTELMVAGFGVSGGTVETAELEAIGRRLFDPLLVLSGNSRGAQGELLRLPYLSVADNNGNVWRAQVEVDSGRTIARAGRFSLIVRVRELTSDAAAVDISPESLATAPDSPSILPPLLDPNNLLGS